LNSILLFGGTFDPVHNGHTSMAIAALAETGASQLIIFPAGNPYQKGRQPFASAQSRTRMLQIAFADTANVSIDARELERDGPTYTSDTLRELRQIHSEDRSLIWLIGGDAFAKLDSWHQWQSLFSLANFAVVVRQGEPHPLTAASAALKSQLAGRHIKAHALGATPFGRYAMLAAEVPPVSSTDIRARLRNRQTIRGLAPDGVCDYIERHKLYGPEEKT
jgi:nicotinate-nucleotide adenylyltransferase